MRRDQPAKPQPQPSAPVFERDKSLGYVVNHLARMFARALDRALAPHGVALGQFPLLLILWEQDGLTQSEIARRLDIEQPTVANTLRRMERDGLVTFKPDPNNGRQVLIRLTAKGGALRAALTAEALAVNARAAATLSPQELTTFLRILDKMRTALGAD